MITISAAIPGSLEIKKNQKTYKEDTNLKKNNRGFTLAELLIVVAIIAVLTAIAIPVFTTQLEKSREATDISNIRSAYAEVVAAGLVDPAATNLKATVTYNQQVDDWQSDKNIEIAGVKLSQLTAPTKGGTVDIVWVPANGANDAKVTIGGVDVKMNNGVGGSTSTGGGGGDTP